MNKYDTAEYLRGYNTGKIFENRIQRYEKY